MPFNVHATTIKTNKWYSITVPGGRSRKLSFKMPSKGYVYFEGLGVGSLGDGLSWTEWTGYKNYFNYEQYEKGKKLTLKLYGREGKESTQYKFCVRILKSKYFESEKNNKKGRAEKLVLGKTFSGRLESNDKDWYVFTAPKSGKYSLTAGLYDPSGDEDLIVTLYLETTKKASHRVKNSTTLFSGKVKKGRRIFVKVSQSLYSDVLYKIKVKKG